MKPKIPFNRPSIEGDEMEYMRAAIESGHSSAKGPFSQRASQILADRLGSEEALLTTSCTSALELSAMLLDLKPGDTVIVPSFTFVTTALSFAREGASLLFADIEEETLGLDPAHVAELIDDSVRAVVAVHYAGIGCDLDGLRQVLEGHPGIDLIEDNAHGLFGTYEHRPLGSFGRFSTLSFHETKNFVCGEGGALLLNHEADVARAHVMYDKGTNRRAFMMGQVDKYSWVDAGSSFGMSDILAAYLLGQLEARDSILTKRRRLFERYERRLGPEAENFGYRTPVVPSDRQPAYHMFYVLLPDRATRDHVLAELNERGIQATFHYIPLHDAPGAAGHSSQEARCPKTTEISGRLIRLPFFNSLALEDVDHISDTFLEAVDTYV